ncbi:MAG: 30S ribosomal protein S15 [Acidobacteriota bacterium]|nr:30S ribosomal protein S15 [Acidobacteriota bacterium]
MLTKEKKSTIVSAHKRNPQDTGSTEVQIALLSDRISQLSHHLGTFKKDHSSRNGLMRLVGQRKRLLGYIKREDVQRYEQLILKLGLRK